MYTDAEKLADDIVSARYTETRPEVVARHMQMLSHACEQYDLYIAQIEWAFYGTPEALRGDLHMVHRMNMHDEYYKRLKFALQRGRNAYDVLSNRRGPWVLVCEPCQYVRETEYDYMTDAVYARDNAPETPCQHPFTIVDTRVAYALKTKLWS